MLMQEAHPIWRLMALTANCHRDPKKPAFQARQFMPFQPRRRVAPLSELKAQFTQAQSPAETNDN